MSHAGRFAASSLSLVPSPVGLGVVMDLRFTGYSTLGSLVR
jgi:hypothetical protein